eukprot:351308-Chlamydomonas_euryale.AAC.3
MGVLSVQLLSCARREGEALHGLARASGNSAATRCESQHAQHDMDMNTHTNTPPWVHTRINAIMGCTTLVSTLPSARACGPRKRPPRWRSWPRQGFAAAAPEPHPAQLGSPRRRRRLPRALTRRRAGHLGSAFARRSCRGFCCPSSPCGHAACAAWGMVAAQVAPGWSIVRTDKPKDTETLKGCQHRRACSTGGQPDTCPVCLLPGALGA